MPPRWRPCGRSWGTTTGSCAARRRARPLVDRHRVLPSGRCCPRASRRPMAASSAWPISRLFRQPGAGQFPGIGLVSLLSTVICVCSLRLRLGLTRTCMPGRDCSAYRADPDSRTLVAACDQPRLSVRNQGFVNGCCSARRSTVRSASSWARCSGPSRTRSSSSPRRWQFRRASVRGGESAAGTPRRTFWTVTIPGHVTA